MGTHDWLLLAVAASLAYGLWQRWQAKRWARRHLTVSIQLDTMKRVAEQERQISNRLLMRLGRLAEKGEELQDLAAQAALASQLFRPTQR